MSYNTFLLVPKSKMDKLLEQKCDAEKNLKIHQANFFDLENGKMSNINTAGKIPNSILRKNQDCLDEKNKNEIFPPSNIVPPFKSQSAQTTKTTQMNQETQTQDENMNDLTSNDDTIFSSVNEENFLSERNGSSISSIPNDMSSVNTGNFQPNFNSTGYSLIPTRSNTRFQDRSMQFDPSVQDKSVQFNRSLADKSIQNIPSTANKSINVLNSSALNPIVRDEFETENISMDRDDSLLTELPYRKSYWVSDNRKAKTDLFSSPKKLPYQKKKMGISNQTNLNESKEIKDLIKKASKKGISKKTYVPHIKKKRNRSDITQSTKGEIKKKKK